MKRTAALVLGLLYLLQASWLLQGGADLLFPRTQTVAAGATACCTSGCGCPAEAQARKACCCYPKGAEEPVPKAVRIPLSAIEEARCKGLREAGVELISLPALQGPVFVPAPPRVEPIADLPERRPCLPPPDRSPEKVPI